MTFNSKMASSCAVAALALGLAASEAQAGAFGLREQSATGQGVSFAGAAAGGAGLGSMFWNPAAMTDYKGIQVEGSISGVFPFAKLTTDSTSALSAGKTSGDIAQDVALPATYGTWQVGKDVWLGLSVNAPFGLATKYDPSWGTGRNYGTTSRATSTEVTPSLAYQINDQLSVGVGMRVMAFKAIYKLSVVRDGGLEGDGTGLGASAGITYKPDNKTEIGIGYRSVVQQDLTGNYTSPSTGAVSPIKLRVMLPDSVTVGVKRKLTDQWTVLAGYEWTNWSRVQFPVYYNQNTGARIGSLPLGYKDGWMASLGLEYAMNPNWTLRSGVAYEYSPIRDDTRGPRLPDNDRVWLSLGAGYKFDEKLSFDLGYTHILPKNTKMNVASGNPTYIGPSGPYFGTYTGKFDSHIDIVSVSMRYRFDTPAAPAALPKK